jgi:hypothetical protein
VQIYDGFLYLQVFERLFLINRFIILKMQRAFFEQQRLLRFYAVGVRYAAIDGTDSSALRLFVKTNAFGAFVGHYIIVVVRDGRIDFVGIDFAAIMQHESAF